MRFTGRGDSGLGGQGCTQFLSLYTFEPVNSLSFLGCAVKQ